MALSDTIALSFRPKSGPVVIPVSGTSQWVSAIVSSGANTGPAVADASPITNPTTQVTSSTRRIVRREEVSGTYLLVRLGYASAASDITSPIINVFGRTGSDDWEKLPNINGDFNATLTADEDNDIGNGTLRFTSVGDDQKFDMNGCEEFLIGVDTAYAAVTNEGTNSIIQVKGV